MELTFWQKIEKIAQGLPIKDGTVRQWKHRGSVPAKWHYKLSEAAKTAEINLSLEDLNGAAQ